MKRKIVVLLIISIIIGLIPLQVFANNDIIVILNGEKINFDVNPEIINNRTMVPMRTIFEKFGMNIVYSNGNITASDNNNSIKMTINKKTIIKNGINISIDVAPIIKNNRTLVPIRAISECLNANVQWDNNNNTVIINTSENINNNNQLFIPDYNSLSIQTENMIHGVRIVYDLLREYNHLSDSEFYSKDYKGRFETIKTNCWSIIDCINKAMEYCQKNDGYEYVENDLRNMKSELTKIINLDVSKGYRLEFNRYSNNQPDMIYYDAYDYIKNVRDGIRNISLSSALRKESELCSIYKQSYDYILKYCQNI